jgi:uncharacterized YigZ family protein
MVDLSEQFNTLAGDCEAELVVQRSRFIGYAAPVSSRDEARAFIDTIAEQHPKARHCCWAYKTGYPDSPEEYYTDAGEPSGSAGSPILLAISTSGLQNIVVVVIRYFGGIKLGIRGLIEAYRTTAQLTLEKGTCIRKQPMTSYRITCSYAQFESLKHIVETTGGTVMTSDFKEAVTCTASIPRNMGDTFTAQCESTGINATPVN